MESKELSKKKKRKFFGRADRFLSQEFGKDIVKKLKTSSNTENKTKTQENKEDILEKDEEVKKEAGEIVLKNKRYEIKFLDERVDKFISGLKLADQSQYLNSKRFPCPKCKRNSCLYCSECLLPVVSQTSLPKTQLPMQLAILWHKQEKKSKSSALPLQMLCEPLVKIVPFPENEQELSEVFEKKSTVFLYPHKNSSKVSELSLEELENIKHVVAIECTWNQTNGILKELKNTGKKYKYIQLNDYETFFWRHQKHAEKCLATCEAIYYFFKEFDQALKEKKGETKYVYDGKFDNLLFFFVLQFKTILQIHEKN